MIRQKCSKIRKIKASLQDLLAPLTGKPALTCAIVLMAVYAALDCPEFALVLLLPVAACIRFFPKSQANQSSESPYTKIKTINIILIRK